MVALLYADDLNDTIDSSVFLTEETDKEELQINLGFEMDRDDKKAEERHSPHREP
jgi:hypothetical protein